MIRKGDTVTVIAGRDKGKSGKVLAIMAGLGRATVEKLNMVKRHTKPTQANRQGGILDKEATIHLSNLMLFCSKCKKPVRARIKIGKDGDKTRNCAKCGQKVGV